MNTNSIDSEEDFRLNFDDDNSNNHYSQINDDDDVLELTGKDSNFVFFFGSAGTGKSVILASLLYYMKTKLGVFRPKSNTPNTDEAKLLLENYFEEITKGKLPSRTLKNQVTRFDLVFDPNNKSKKIKPINLTFLEISGEDHRTLRQAEGGEYIPQIQIFLNSNIPIFFIVVARYDTAREDDYLISKFFDKLESYRKNLKSVNAILVISQWDKSGSKQVDDPQQLEQFIRNNLPFTNAIFDNYKLSKTYFTIGKIETDSLGKEKLKTINTHTPKLLSNWLYKSITGYPIDYEGTFWEKLKWSLGI